MKIQHILLLGLLTGIWIWSLPILMIATFFMMPFAGITLAMFFIIGVYIQYKSDENIMPEHWIRKYISLIPWYEWFPCNTLRVEKGIIACHPHGLLCCGPLAGIHFVKDSKTCMCIAPIVFYVPIIGIMAKYLGCIPATKTAMAKALQKGYPVLVVPGGVPEIVLTETKNDKKRFKRHGFLRLAKELSVPLFAVFTKGECATFNMVRWPFLNTRVKLSWYLNVPVTLPFIFGWYGTWVPKRIHLKMKMSQVCTKTKEHYQYILNELYD